MPIDRVPVVHKFGIISHTQRLELQERLLKQSYLQTFGTKKPASVQSRNPLEVTEEFVLEYNAVESLDSQEKYEEQAYRMLERIKRRAGLKDGGVGNHVDLPVAWTELSQLAQCKGKIQEECLDMLCVSLDQAPLDKQHIPALFYLAETTLYWLRTDAIQQPYLRAGEIKLLRMGQLTFIRLFYHHMSGQLQGHDQFKNRLFTYLDGFAESQYVYRPYPNALLCLRHINEIGKMIIGDCANLEAGEVKEGDNVQGAGHTLEKPSSAKSDRQSLKSAEGKTEVFNETLTHYGRSQSSQSGAISSSVHDLSPTLWHSLDVWRCVNHQGAGVTESLKALASCGMGLASESWVDGICAMQVLSDAAKTNLSALRVLQGMARGVQPKSTPPPTPRQESGTTYDEVSAENNSYLGTKPALSDIFENSEDNSDASRQDHVAGGSSSAYGYSADTEESAALPMVGSSEVKSKYAASETTKQKTVAESEAESFPQTAWKAEVGTDLASGRASDASSVPTFTNAVHPGMPGLHGWHWEVAVTYTDVLADVCLHGSTSTIQKVALVGNNKDMSNLHKMTRAQCPMRSAGLLDLAYFHALKEATDGSADDWSWRVRYSALQALVRVCRSCARQATKEGMHTVAWNALLTANSQERDTRVLEALRVGKVDTSVEHMLSQPLLVTAKSLGAKVAQGLSLVYLPPLPPPVGTPSPQLPRNRPKPQLSVVKPNTSKPLRTSLREEVMLATALYESPVDFNLRTSFDLKRIVEDQWRKELQVKLDEDEGDRQKELNEKQKQEETKEREMEEKRREKLKHKYAGRTSDAKKLGKHAQP